MQRQKDRQKGDVETLVLYAYFVVCSLFRTLRVVAAGVGRCKLSKGGNTDSRATEEKSARKTWKGDEGKLEARL